jgi:diguanylate cyclase (GGDEF)-like protein
MHILSTTRFKLISLIVLPLFLISLLVLWTTSSMLNGISNSVNKQDNSRTWQAVQFAFRTIEERLTGTIIDNAHWDEAAEHLYNPINQEWIAEVWGTASTGANYDFMFIVNARGNTIASFAGGSSLAVTAEARLGKNLIKSLALLPRDKTKFATISSLIETPSGFDFIAAAPILPLSKKFSIPNDRPNYLIFGRHMSRDLLAKISNQLDIDEMDVSSFAEAISASHKLKDAWGNPIAGVTWQSRNPGETARAKFQYYWAGLLAALVGLLFPISYFHFRTISTLETTRKQATHLAYHDLLTGLPNRAYFIDQLNNHLRTAELNELAVIYIDLDGFKTVNDTYDHETGDKLLKAIAAGFSALLENRETLARLGGDEFAILIKGKFAQKYAEVIAKRMLAFVNEPFDIDGRTACVGASIGISKYDQPELTTAEMLRQADVAMYDAKEFGRNQFRHFEKTLDDQHREDQAIATELKGIIARNELEVAYQPMVHGGSRKILGVEALARWPRSSARKLGPDKFIQIAEEYGLIDALGTAILKKSTADIARYPTLQLAVNVSVLQLNNPNFVKNIQRITSANGFALSRLEVEFTETILIANPKRAKSIMAELKSLGIMISLDDFGTGFASVGYLREYEFDKIKLDRSLTQSILQSAATQQVVQGTVLIAKGLAAQVIAEGIETEAEAQIMHLAGCNQMQGYYFGKPQSVEAIEMLTPQHVPQLQLA